MKACVVSYPVDESAKCGDFAAVIPLTAGRQGIIVGDVAGRGPAVGDVAASLFVWFRDLMAVGVRPSEVLYVAHTGFARTMMTEAIPFTSLFIAVIHSAVRAAVRDAREPARAICDTATAHAGGKLADDASVPVVTMSSPVVLRPPLRTAR